MIPSGIATSSISKTFNIDIDNNGSIDLNDVILSLKIIAGHNDANVETNDQKIGIRKIVTILQVICTDNDIILEIAGNDESGSLSGINTTGDFWLKWNNLEYFGTTIYQIQVSKSNEFNTNIAEHWVTDTTIQIYVGDNAEYSCRVRAWSDLPENNGSHSKWSNVEVQEVFLLTPPNILTINPDANNILITVTWTEINRSEIYQVQCSQDPNFIIDVTELWPLSNLETFTIFHNGIFHFRVRAWNNLPDNGGIGTSWSRTKSYQSNIQLLAPKFQNIQSPVTNPDLDVMWNVVNGASIYELIISDGYGFTNNSSYWPTNPVEDSLAFTKDGVYYFKVRAWDNLPEERGIAGLWSDIEIVEVDVQPNKPLLNSYPTVVNSLDLNISWVPIENSKIYSIYVSDQANFANIIDQYWPSGNHQLINVPSFGIYYVKMKSWTDLPEKNGISSDDSNIIQVFFVSDSEVTTPYVSNWPLQPVSSEQFSLIGEKQENTSIWINGIEKISLNSSTSWTTNVELALSDGDYLFEIVAIDEFGNVSLSNTNTITKDTSRPEKPTVNAPEGSIGSSFYILSGTKQANTSIWINNKLVVPINNQIFWEYKINLENGNNTLTIQSKDESIPANYSDPVNTNIHVITDSELLDRMHAKASKYALDQKYPNGLILDISNSLDKASIAASGFGLGALIVAHFRAESSEFWGMQQVNIEQQINNMLQALLFIQNNQHVDPDLYGTSGFFYHFINENGQRYYDSEVSAIDNAILAAGLLLAGEYFGGDIKINTQTILNQMDWSLFKDSKLNFFFEYWTPEKGLSYSQDIYKYFNSDELLLICLISYILNPHNQEYKSALFSWDRPIGKYANYEVYYSFYGSLFTYYYAHCFFDFESMGYDKPESVGANIPSVNWWLNSKNAVLANRQFCINNQTDFSSYSPNSWGLSAVLKPDGKYYGDYGSQPCQSNNGKAIHDGTVSTTEAVAVMPIIREENEELADNLSMQALRYMFDKFGENAFDYASFNQHGEYADKIIGINILPVAMMLENYRSGLIWNQLMNNPQIQSTLSEIFTFTNMPINTTKNLEIEAEHFAKQFGGVVDYKSNASGGQTLGGGWGIESIHYAIYNTYIMQEQNVFLRLKYSDEIGNNTIYVFFNGEHKGAFITEKTDSWNEFAWGESIHIGPTSTGNHEIKIMSGGSEFGVNLDVLTIKDPSLLSPEIIELNFKDGDSFQFGETIDLSVTTISLNKDELEYQFSVNGEIKQLWSTLRSFSLTPNITSPGLYAVEIEVRNVFNKKTSRIFEYYVFRNPIPPPTHF